jgi:hypothetical protein
MIDVAIAQMGMIVAAHLHPDPTTEQGVAADDAAD